MNLDQEKSLDIYSNDQNHSRSQKSDFKSLLKKEPRIVTKESQQNLNRITTQVDLIARQ
ncbi:unnamed protein product [Paramecium sonneborni]|uniref:Uncharacterized protein n=1 Tax=Paramecium sonneborni TaxID=65129 RepID=A0A8S1MPC1_9CILI|nr:unnamed protein product [Paramecium sonneborni]